MPGNPVSSALHTNQYLTDVSVLYSQDSDKFIANKAAPLYGSDKKSDQYPIFDKGDWFRDEAEAYTSGAESAGGGWNLSNDTYTCVRYAIHKDNTEEDYANADSVFNLDEEATRYVTEKLHIRQDQLFVAAAMATGLWTTDEDGVTGTPSTNQYKRFDESGSVPLDEILGFNITIEQLTGRAPNIAVAHPSVYKALRLHADITDQLKYTSQAIATPEVLASLFDLESFMVARSVYNSANEGATDSVSYAVGKDMLLAYVNPNAGLYEPTALKGFYWRGLTGAGDNGMRIKRMEIPEKSVAARIEGDTAVAYKLVAADLGAFLEDAVS